MGWGWFCGRGDDLPPAHRFGFAVRSWLCTRRSRILFRAVSWACHALDATAMTMGWRGDVVASQPHSDKGPEVDRNDGLMGAGRAKGSAREGNLGDLPRGNGSEGVPR